MRIAALLFGLILPAGALAVAPYPTMLTGEYKGQRYPVVHVHGHDPRMLVDGSEKETWEDPRYEVKITDGFADNFVSSLPGTLTGPFQRKVIGDPNEYGPRSFRTDYAFLLTATKSIKRGFAVVVLYAERLPNIGPASSFISFPPPTIIVHDLPQLPAGKTVKVKFSDNGYVDGWVTRYFIQIFDDSGREVRTTDSAYAWQYYAWRSRVSHANALITYLGRFHGIDQEASPSKMPKPVFPLDAVKPSGEFTVVLNVEANGSVSAVDASQIADGSIRQCVIDAMEGWLFLPKLQAGTPVATKVSVPLKL